MLNARYHEQEAFIVANAGVPGAVTVATNMAGRGTDIQLGGNADMRLAAERAEKEKGLGRVLSEGEISLLSAQIRADIEVKKKQALDAGGLYVLGTERHESRRIDNQLRGRTGRQGDPGRSKFYISIEDDLMRIFAADRMDTVMRRLGIKEDEGITHPWMNKAMETSQRKIEERNFEMRKNVLKYDDVINDQRKAIFEQRLDFLRSDDVSETILDMRENVIDALVARTMPEKAYAEQWDMDGLAEACALTLRCRPAGQATGPAKKASPTRKSPSASAPPSTSIMPRWRPPSATSRFAASRNSCCCRCSTCAGAITCSISTSCARLSTCGPMASATR